MTFFEFMSRRIIRLYPMFFMGIIIGVISWYVANGNLEQVHYSSGVIVTSSIYNMFFLPYFNCIGYDLLFPVNTSLWSLFFELFANMFCIMLFRLNNDALRKLIILIYVVIVVQGCLERFVDYHINVTDAGWSTTTFLAGFPRVFYGFILGVLLYRFAQDNVKVDMIKKYAGFFITKPFLFYIILMAVFLFPFRSGLYYLLVIAVIAPLFVFVGSLSVCQNSISLKISHFLGWMSYPVYCLHKPIGVIVNAIFEKYHFDPTHRLAMVSVLATLAISAILTRFYEEPVRNLLTKRLKTFESRAA